MSAPDKHWLLIKQYWQPIEELLKEASPDSDTSQEQIDRLSGRVDASTVSQLHRLRMARNDVIHGNKPLPDEQAFIKSAISAAKILNSLQGKNSPAQHSDDIRGGFNLAFWAMTFVWVHVATQAGGFSDQAPLAWKTMALIYSPLVWFVKAAIDVPFSLVSVPLIIVALSAVTSVLPRSWEFILRIYVLLPLPLALLAKAF